MKKQLKTKPSQERNSVKAKPRANGTESWWSRHSSRFNFVTGLDFDTAASTVDGGSCDERSIVAYKTVLWLPLQLPSCF